VLKNLTLLRDRVQDWQAYPFSVAAIRELKALVFRSRISFFAGENGTGKSTLLEAIAAHYGFGREGGNRNFQNDSTESNRSVDPLVKALRLSFDRRTGAGFFLRAESFFNTATHIDKLDEEPGAGPPISAFYGGRSLHTRSHGETFFTVLDLKFRRNGLFLLDEPEAALSPQRPMSFLVLIHDVLPVQGRAVHHLNSLTCSARVSEGPKSSRSIMEKSTRSNTNKLDPFRWRIDS